jgi:hypothetical protein
MRIRLLRGMGREEASGSAGVVDIRSKTAIFDGERARGKG